MRRLLRSKPFLMVARNSVPEYRPEANDTKCKNWLARLSSLSSKPASKVYLSQLSGLISYYNKTVTDTVKPIDFAAWKSKIITGGLVDKVQSSFEELSHQEYDLDKVFNDVFSKDSKAIDDINNEMAFHTAIWLVNYEDYVRFLSDLETYSNFKDYDLEEQLSFFPTVLAKSESLMETNNYLIGSKDDVNLYGFMAAQFNWGKRITTFYKHTSEDMRGCRATKNSMGR